ncbi:MAG: hypothetical protein AAF657_19145 [Acidobacteriota bacterium]
MTRSKIEPPRARAASSQGPGSTNSASMTTAGGRPDSSTTTPRSSAGAV